MSDSSNSSFRGGTQRTPIISAHFALGAVAMFSGVALLISLYANANLGLIWTALAIFAACTALVIWSRADAARRGRLTRIAKVGLIAGVLATLGYDASRFLIVYIGNLRFAPFHAFRLFGELVVGTGANGGVALIIGTIYHYVNGITFAIGYGYVFGGRHWVFGVFWALGLEIAMLSVYPGWLHLRALMLEFTLVSLAGHLFYGSILGWYMRRGLVRHSR